MAAPRLLCVGECMLELAELRDGTITRGFGGDSLNTAVYASRSGANVGYLTALGDDPFSADMMAEWRKEGIDVGAVRQEPDRVPGLYWIRTDQKGERSFYYWRTRAPYRDLFKGASADAALGEMQKADWLYLTGITLAVLDKESQSRVFDAMRAVNRAGGQVCFDVNYRKQLWEDVAEAAEVMERALSMCTVALPGLDDMRAVFGCSTPEAALAQLDGYGIDEAVVKDGAGGVHLSRGTQIPAPQVERIVDTTAAGDAFNGAYLAARMAKEGPTASAWKGQAMAAKVVQARGAIVPR